METYIFCGYQFQFQIIHSNENQSSSTLRIVAEHKTTFEKFFGELTVQEVLRVTDDICKTPEVLLHRLLDAFQKNSTQKDRKVTVKLAQENDQLNIHYEEIAIFYKHEHKTNFVVTLTKVEVNEIDLLQRRIHELELQIAESIGSKGEYVWNANSAPANCFQVTEGGKKVRKIGTTGWAGIRTDKPFPPNGKHRFSIVLNEVVSNTHLMLGVSLGDAPLTAGAFATLSAWMWYMLNQTRQRGGTNQGGLPQSFLIPRVNDIITLIVDVDHLMVAYEINGFACGVAYVMNENTDRKSLYPTVDMNAFGTEVTIL